jgi:pimeloyl-ACP methyl ester carboxylesterase
MPRPFCHRPTLALVGLLTATVALAGAQTNDPANPVRYLVLLQGRSLGGELVTTTSSAAGWLISTTGSVDAPFSLMTSKFQLRYTSDWQPLSLSMEGTRNGQLVTLNTTFTPTTAVSDVMQGGQPSTIAHQVSARTIALPNGIFAPYIALAARLENASIGARIPIYVVPQAEITATVDRVIPHRLMSSTGPLELREFDLTFANPQGPLAAEVWLDARNRLARVAIPASSLVVVREDLASVTTRDETLARPGDEEVFIPSLGFNLAGTLSKPSALSGRGAAVVLVGGSGPQTRDEKVFGIPIFGQIAAAIADAGFIVARYDKRGVGRSGGRIENATLTDYADDVSSVVQWLRNRRDVDPNRIAVVGHSEGAAVALIIGAREKKRVSALCLIAGPGQTGREVTLEQQAHALAKLNESDDTKKAKIDLENRIIDAVTKGTGWEGIPPELRRQADTPWFRSWLLFDPAAAMAKIEQPVLIVQGSLDTQVPPAHADRLETASRQRKKMPPTATRKVVIPGINHLLVPAKTGEVDEYPALSGADVAPAVTSAITDWLKEVLAPAIKR